MAYVTVTVDVFKNTKRQFSEIDTAVISDYLTLAGVVVDQSWMESSYQPAIIAMTCHLMTIEGLGDDAASELFSDGMADFQTVRSSELSLSRFQKAAANTAYEDWLLSTPCGKQFLFLLKMNKGGPRILTGSFGFASGYSKDHQNPAYGWPGVFLQCQGY